MGQHFREGKDWEEIGSCPQTGEHQSKDGILEEKAEVMLARGEALKLTCNVRQLDRGFCSFIVRLKRYNQRRWRTNSMTSPNKT